MNTLYHYTDLNALLSIIKNKQLWLTGANNLNDHKEISWTTTILAEKLSTLATKQKEKADLLWHIYNHSLGVPFICSLTSEPDLLSQWRGYGDSAHGVAIGFRREALPSSERIPFLSAVRADSISLHQVIYERALQEGLIDEILSPIFSHQRLDEQTHLAISSAAAALNGLATLLKNPAFSEEKEWRIIHRPMIMGRQGTNETNVMLSISAPKHRIARNRLITYFEYDLIPNDRGSVFSELVLGPKCEISEYDLSIFLTLNGLSDLPIKKSVASYR